MEGDALRTTLVTSTPEVSVDDAQSGDTNILDMILGDEISDAVLEELIADDEAFEATEVSEPEVELEPAHDEDESRTGDQDGAHTPDAHQHTETESDQEDGTEPDQEDGTVSEPSLPTCVICLDDVQAGRETWACDGCSLQLDISCARTHRASDVNAVCPICKAEFDIDEDVVIIGAVPPPRRCVVCDAIAHGTGYYVDGPNCDHRCHYTWIHEFNGIN
jgi:hypothetical protein